MAEEELEQAFHLIKNGKSQGEEGQHWRAAVSFLQACCKLQKLADNHSTENDEEKKIQQLYSDQSSEYFHRSRESLIQALQEENGKDREEKTVSCQDLSEEEVKKRKELFISTFSKPVNDPVSLVTAEADANTGDEQQDNNKKVLEKQLSLEERLAELNSNLPKELKSSTERLQDLNHGMKRLGLSAYTSTSNNSSDINNITPPKSASQQVEDIIAQAKDEVAMQVPDNTTDADVPDNDSVVFSVDDYLSDDSDGVDSLLSDEVAELQNFSQIRDEVAATQAKLAELQALMESATTSMPSGEGGEGDKDEAADNFDPVYAKQKLKDAKTSLHKALKLWKVKANPV